MVTTFRANVSRWTTSPRLVSIFRRGSTTYFYSSLFFSGSVRRDVFALYAFVRTADDFVDGVPQDVAGFERFVAGYRAALGGVPSGEVVIDSFVELSGRTRFDPAWTESFFAAMQRDVQPRAYETISELEDYMYGSAEVIGLFMSRVLDLPDTAQPAARRLGKAMQYANFLRDVAEDHELGRTYVPRQVLEQHGLASLGPDHVAQHPERFASLMRHEIARYRRWEDQAEAGFRFLAPRVRIPVQTAAGMYRWTMDEIERDPHVVYTRRLKPRPTRVVASVARNALTTALPGPDKWSVPLSRLTPWR